MVAKSGRWYSELELAHTTPLLMMVVYTMTCAILGHRTAFSVKIDSNEQVSELKEQIRAKAFQMLHSFQAFDLKLYKINTPMPDDLPTYETLIDSIYLRAIRLNEGNKLRHPFLKTWR